MGFGANSKVHTAKLFEISSELTFKQLTMKSDNSGGKNKGIHQKGRTLFEQTKSGGLITIEKLK